MHVHILSEHDSVPAPALFEFAPGQVLLRILLVSELVPGHVQFLSLSFLNFLLMYFLNFVLDIFSVYALVFTEPVSGSISRPVPVPSELVSALL